MSKTRPLKHGRIYHVYNRGVNRETLFKEERNYSHFLKLVTRHIHAVADIYAYCLMKNHFHLLLRIRMQSEIKRSAAKPLWRVPPARMFGNCFNAYTKAINAAYARTGCLFERPFKRKIVTSPEYFRQLVVYIHRNPERHGVTNLFSDWPHSSFARFDQVEDPVLELSTVVAAFGGLGEFVGAHHDPAPLLGDGSFGDFG